MKNIFFRVLLIITLCLTSFIGISQDSVGYDFPMGVSENDIEELEKMPQKAVLTRSFYDVVNLPNSYSLKQYAPIPKEQKYGTCTAWATAYAARTIIEAKANNWTDKEFITENAFSPAFTYRITEPNKKKCKGASTLSIVTSLKMIGALPLKNWKVDENKKKDYYCPDEIGADLNLLASNFKIIDFSKLFSDPKPRGSKTEKVKLSLSNGNPVVIMMSCPNSFQKIKKFVWEPTEYPNFGKYSNHAMTVVGYDNNKFGGAFEIQNSWGTDYADEGYVWVTYKDFNAFVYGAIELFEYIEPAPEAPLFKGALSVLNIAEQKKHTATLKNYNGITYKINEALTTGSRIRFYLQNDEDAFVYMLGTGSIDTSVNKLFPVNGINALLNYKENEVPIPSEEHYFEMDDTVGKDYIVLLYSKEKLEIERLLDFMNETEGSIDKKLFNIFDNQIISNKDIQFNENKMKFETFSKDKSKIMAIIIEFNHN
ncbi:MAG: hypothetical protein COB12_00185 [Flavobacterium sp.]|nr:MAG: hypothetical protein COB12_00185 [Flavobacterium sp.]